MFLIFMHFGSLDFAHGLRRRRAHARRSRGRDADRDRPAAAGRRHAASPRRFRSTSGCPTPWPARRRSPPSIHAATMVTAGVYMVARCARPSSLHAPQRSGRGRHRSAWRPRSSPPPSAWRRTTSRRSSPTRRFRSSATCSSASASGAFSAGIFHLMTHAFFKALLFLGAGSVIHALRGEQDLRNMGGLRKQDPRSPSGPCCAPRVAIAGVPPFSGFLSKDAILLAAYHHAPWMYWVGVLTAGMTAFYVFRALFLAFFGEYRGHHHPHESPARDDAAAGGAGRCCRSAAATSTSRTGSSRCSRIARGRGTISAGLHSPSPPALGGHRAGLSLLRRAGPAWPDAVASTLGRPLHAGLQQVLRG